MEITFNRADSRTRGAGQYGVKTLLSVALVYFICLFWYSTASAQLWSGILDHSRATDWSQTGVTGGIPNRTNICQTVPLQGSPGSPASASVINTAIQNCSSAGGGVVQLQAGTYYLNSSIAFNSAKNVTLRGQGPDQTTLEFDDTFSSGCSQGGVVCINDYGWSLSACNFNAPPNLANWTANYAPGTTQLVLDRISGPGSPTYTLTAGMLLLLDQLDPPATDFTNYVPFPMEYPQYVVSAGCNANRAGRCVGEVHSVTAVTGTGPYTVTITPPIAYHSWNANGNNQPQAFWCGTAAMVPMNDGVENVTVLNNTTAGVGYGLVRIEGAAQSWMKNVRAINTVNAGFAVRISANVEMRDSYLFHQNNASSCLTGGTQYGINPVFSGFVKFENNIFQQLCSGIMMQPCFVCVFGYNYVVGEYGVGGFGGNFGYAAAPGHVGGTHSLLFEGNIMNGVNTDHLTAHGTNAAFFVMFRNYFTGELTPGIGLYSYPVFNGGINRFNSYIGNVLGVPALAGGAYESSPIVGWVDPQTKISMWNFAWGCGDRDSKVRPDNYCRVPFVIPNDTITATSLMRWGNWDAVTNAVRWNSSEVPTGSGNFTQFIPATHNLPASFYIASKPAWFGSSPWPIIGPDVTGGFEGAGHAGSIPARDCYLNIMHGPTDGSGGVLTFNAASCYGSTTNQPGPATPTGLKVL